MNLTEAELGRGALEQLFLEARTFSDWQDKPISDEDCKRIYELAKLGPTSSNASPARFVFIRTSEGKDKLKPFLSSGNLEKTMSAPLTVIVAHDLDFADRIPELFPHFPAAAKWFAPEDIKLETAFRNSSLQGAYLILAARSLGFDCGPMSGFDPQGLDKAFFSGTNVKSNFLVNIGYGEPSNLHPRLPRLSFEDACQIA